MSAPVAGKFQDHYVVMGVEPTATPEDIQNAYTRLAQEYHPSNPTTGDKEKFEALNLAYEVLSQSDLRSEFDKLKGINREGAPKFSGQPFFDSLGRDAGLRAALLSVLYDRRKNKPFQPSLSVRHTENIVRMTLEEMTFALWYLKERGWVISDDKSSLQITSAGLDYVEQARPTPELIMPFIKSSGLANPVIGWEEPAAEFEPEEAASVDATTEEAGQEMETAEETEIAEEEVTVAATPTVEDPQRRANLNRILGRSGA